MSDSFEKNTPVGRISKANWIAVVLLGFSGQLAWAVENQFFNTFLYEKITPDPRPISWMVSASAIVALLSTLLMGTLSDGTNSRKWGKRRPYILIGYLLWGIFTAAYPTAAILHSVTLGVGMAILFDCLMTFFGSAANDAAFNAFVTDITTNENRGRVVSVTEILKWVALLVTYGGAGFLVAYFGYFTFFVIIAVLVIVMGLVGGSIAKESTSIEMPKVSYWRCLYLLVQPGEVEKILSVLPPEGLFMRTYVETQEQADDLLKKVTRWSARQNQFVRP